MFTEYRPFSIGGGMGVYISTPFSVREFSLRGGLGTVSGVAAGEVLARILQRGDPGGHYRFALKHFPYQEYVQPILEEYFVEGGIPKDQSFKKVPLYTLEPTKFRRSLSFVATFALVWIAKHDDRGVPHNGLVSINFLEKIQLPLLDGFVGAMLAGVDCITMGAGIALQVPGVLDSLAKDGIAAYKLHVEGSKDKTHSIFFSMREFFGNGYPKLRRPAFLPIVSSVFLAELFLGNRATGKAQGFVVETSTAGGHNAPPRGKPIIFNAQGEPVYGERDIVDLKKLVALGLPVWIGGSYASPEALVRVRSLGLAGIQVGTVLALTRESGLAPHLAREARQLGFEGKLTIRTDPEASPTGFPLKVAPLGGSLYDPTVFGDRCRVCNLRALATLYTKGDGSVGFRCPAENLIVYLEKGGLTEDGKNARCVCNGLTSSAATVTPGISEALSLGDPHEPCLVTLGDDLSFLKYLMENSLATYSVEDVVRYLLRDI